MKVFMNQPNHIEVDGRLIFINFNYENLEHLKSRYTNNRQEYPDRIMRVDIFITNHTSITNHIDNLFDYLNGLGAEIRLFSKTEDSGLAGLVEKCVEYNRQKKMTKIDIICKTTIHRSYFDECGQTVMISYETDHLSMVVKETRDGNPGIDDRPFRDNMITFDKFYYEDETYESNKGIFDTAEMRLNPENFKEQLIESFKRDLPDEMVNSFKNDEDIWDFINQNGEWECSEDDVI